MVFIFECDPLIAWLLNLMMIGLAVLSLVSPPLGFVSILVITSSHGPKKGSILSLVLVPKSGTEGLPM